MPKQTRILINTTGNLYDFPAYYDVLFNSSWKTEYDFLLKSFRIHAMREVHRVFEPACGTGRLMWRLAKAGFEVDGLDLNANAVEFCNRRLRRHGLNASARMGDIAVDLYLERGVDAAFNFVSSFCHLTTREQAEEHLRLMYEALRPGGIYLLGLHLKPQGHATCDQESWDVRHGTLHLSSNLRTISRNEKTRSETIEFRLLARTLRRTVNLVDRFEFRTYTLAQFQNMIRAVKPSFHIVATYDFSCTPLQVDAYSEDVIFVLRKEIVPSVS